MKRNQREVSIEQEAAKQVSMPKRARIENSFKIEVGDTLPSELVDAIQNIYTPAGLQVTKEPKREGGEKGREYGACRFALNNAEVVFRVAKITPTKIGQFVTVWKPAPPDWKITQHSIIPLSISDGVDFVVISVADTNHRGQFIFNREVLTQKGIISTQGKLGKLSFRVYPPWVKAISPQAIKTQQWQNQHFLSFGHDKVVNFSLVNSLFTVAR
jgi:hypothetical protein